MKANVRKETVVSTEEVFAWAKEKYPNVTFTIDPSLNNETSRVNPKKISDMKRILANLKTPISELK